MSLAVMKALSKVAQERSNEIVAAGRLNNQKNFSILIRAFSKLATRFPEHKLVIYGEGEKRNELFQLIKEKQLSERIFLPGNVEDIGDKMRKACMFVLSSDFEGMPNALMEAMALGLPCISTDCPVGGPRFLIDSGENGILIPTGNEEALVNAMEQILRDPREADVMGKKAHAIIDKCNPNRVYKQWEMFVREVSEKYVTRLK